MSEGSTPPDCDDAEPAHVENTVRTLNPLSPVGIPALPTLEAEATPAPAVSSPSDLNADRSLDIDAREERTVSDFAYPPAPDTAESAEICMRPQTDASPGSGEASTPGAVVKGGDATAWQPLSAIDGTQREPNAPVRSDAGTASTVVGYAPDAPERASGRAMPSLGSIVRGIGSADTRRNDPFADTAEEPTNDVSTAEQSQVDGGADTDPGAECSTDPGADSSTESSTIQTRKRAETWAAGGARLVSEQTVMLDPEQQDKLMELRAQQDATLQERFGDNVTVMFTDLAGSTAYYETHGDLMGRQKMLTHNALLFPIIRTHHGTIIKTIGDGVMICFDTTRSGVAAAAQMQVALRDFNGTCADSDDEIHIRIGVNFGRAIAEDGDLHGDAVNVAARLQDHAQADEIMVSATIAGTELGQELESLGTIAFKGKADPQEVYRVLWDGTAPAVVRTHVREKLEGDRYVLGEPLGRGPMAVVYDAEDTFLQTRVAVKRLHDFVVRDAETREAFLGRVRKMATLRHPGVVRILDVSPPNQGAHYVAERVEGVDLARWLSERGPPTSSAAVGITLQVAEIVGAAHAAGILHGNLKPQNIIMTADGSVRLTDFGMAQIQKRFITGPGGPVTSPAFMAPEQVTGEPVDARTDVYGLGSLLYFLLSGRAPYDATATFQAVRAVASGLYKPVEHYCPDVPPPVGKLCGRMMSTSMDARHATISDLVGELERYAPGAEHDSGRSSPSGSGTEVYSGGDTVSHTGSEPQGPPHERLQVQTVVEATVIAEEQLGRGGPPTLEMPRETTARSMRFPNVVRGLLPALGGVRGASAAAILALLAIVLVAVAYRVGSGAGARVSPATALPPNFAPQALEPEGQGAAYYGQDDPDPGIDAAAAALPGANDVQAPERNGTSRSSAKARRAKGKLSLFTAPAADVFINDRKVGRTPKLKELSLRPGNYRLKLVSAARIPYTERIEILPGRVIRRRIKLKPAQK